MNYNDKLWNNVDRIIENGIKEKVYPGGVILVGTTREILYTKAWL